MEEIKNTAEEMSENEFGASTLPVDPISPEQQKTEEFIIRLFREVQVPWITYLITGLCVLIFLLMLAVSQGESLMKPSGQLLLDFGANFFPKTCMGQWYRLITCAFVHIGIIHLLFNMYIFCQTGNLVERLFGHSLFFLVYIGSAITGSLLSMMVHQNVISAGASGAIFGVYGALFAYYVRFHRSVPREIFRGLMKNAILFVVINLVFGLQPGIDNFAHLGGLIGGFLFGLAAAIPSDHEERKRSFPLHLISTILLITVVSCGGIFGMKYCPSFQGWVQYQKFVNFYVEKEEKAVKQYNEASNDVRAGKITAADYTKIIREDLIPAWQEVKDFSQSVPVFKLNGQQQEIYTMFSENANSWLSICENTCRGIETDQIDFIIKANSELERLNKKIEDFQKKTGNRE
ncbi:MAG: rhomboid family intramembrane serine protease [Planctomycetia bacterium]|nr:rhomboid family intramembrane serine protease [Planctomycetia bacterium]